MNRTEALQLLRERHWKITYGDPSPFQLPPSISVRHSKLPQDFIEFLSGLSICTNQDETTWFLCRDDYHGTSNSDFRWDEFEQASIESADEDPEVLAEISGFWSQHLPFMLSVHSGYAYYAIRTSSDRFGEVVEGFEPMFEEVSVVAKSFSDFLRRFLTESQNERLAPINLDT